MAVLRANSRKVRDYNTGPNCLPALRRRMV